MKVSRYTLKVNKEMLTHTHIVSLFSIGFGAVICYFFVGVLAAESEGTARHCPLYFLFSELKEFFISYNMNRLPEMQRQIPTSYTADKV